MQQTKSVAIYTRVSTTDQTTENQVMELTEYCKNNKLEIYKIYNEEGISGTKTSRPQLDLMLQDMRLRKFDTIIVWKFDRLGRSTIHLLQILEEMKSKDIRLIATSQNIDTNTPLGKFYFTIVGGFAEMERELIRERIMLGIKRRRSQGKNMGRPSGSKDKGRRNKSGYYMRWIKENKK